MPKVYDLKTSHLIRCQVYIWFGKQVNNRILWIISSYRRMRPIRPGPYKVLSSAIEMRSYSTHHWCIWQWLYDQLTMLLLWYNFKSTVTSRCQKVSPLHPNLAHFWRPPSANSIAVTSLSPLRTPWKKWESPQLASLALGVNSAFFTLILSILADVNSLFCWEFEQWW